MKRQPRLTKQSEEYLEAIYKLQERNGVAKTTEIAKQLNVALGSVTNTIECLERKGLIEHKPYKGVKLTEKGKREALKVIRRHRLAERLLVDILKMEWSQVHEAACSLEHALNEEVLKHIERALRYPAKCPHGNPIPTSDGKIEEEPSYPLNMLEIGKHAEIVKLTEESREKLKILEEYRIKPRRKLYLMDKNSEEGFLKVKIDGKSLELSSEIAAIIWVREINE